MGAEMGKYEPLTRYLENMSNESWDARFADVEKVLGFPLPQSAHVYPAWWANQDGGHSQTRGWRDAGWETGQVDLAGKRLRFQRRHNRKASTHTAGREAEQQAQLWENAHRLSGIDDNSKLIEAALTALIQREAGRHLALMGGTMPDLAVPPRDRPDP